MKKLIYLFSVLLVLQIAFFSCNEKEFLTPAYKDKIVDINFLTDPNHAGPAVIAIYDVLGFQGLFTWDRMIMGSSSSDETVEDHGDPEWADLINIDKFLWTPENNHIWEHWEANYTGIARANLVIEKVPALEGLNATLAVRYVAEAKALRALFYYNLVTAHGDVPLTLEPLSFEQAKNLTRTPESEVWDQIITDLKDARDVLPDTYPESDLGRVTKGFANAMLSRGYLWTKEYDKAEAAALAVINSPANYDLEPFMPIYSMAFPITALNPY